MTEYQIGTMIIMGGICIAMVFILLAIEDVRLEVAKLRRLIEEGRK